MPSTVIPALGSLRQENCHEFKASLSYIAWTKLLPYSKKKHMNKISTYYVSPASQ